MGDSGTSATILRPLQPPQVRACCSVGAVEGARQGGWEE
jgi:hypothetical protein